ncbi:protein of unknown function [Nitrospira japonica]|uniref:Lipoprotein n=1 Tax=Nitrospira japonica TaxID=1325564 RepID=A0A1W1I5Y5_9BACT|nr:protein of unknown function [Nitrospira japonica]
MGNCRTARWLTSKVKILSCLLLIYGTLMLGGCINITTRIQPENKDIPAKKEGSDCVPIILGFGAGTADIDAAMIKEYEENAKGMDGDVVRTVRTPYITRVRRIEIQEIMFLSFGARCVNVIGD